MHSYVSWENGANMTAYLWKQCKFKKKFQIMKVCTWGRECEENLHQTFFIFFTFALKFHDTNKDVCLHFIFRANLNVI